MFIISLLCDMISKFPRIKSNILILKDNVSTYLLHNNKKQFIPENVWSVLKLFDGSNTISDIAQKLNGEWDFSIDELIDFVNITKDRGYIDILNLPNKNNINIKTRLYPNTLILVLTDKCNLNCIYCYGDYKPSNKKYLLKEDVLKLLDKCEEHIIESIELTGGEPLLHPDFLEILKYALNKVKHIAILSNGVLFNDELIAVIEENKKKISIQISIDGYSETSFSNMRNVNNTRNRTFNNIQKFAKKGISIKVVYILSYINVNEALKTINYLKSIGVKMISITPIESIGRGANQTMPDQTSYNNRGSDDFKKLIKEIEYIVNLNPELVMPPKIIHYFRHKIDNCGAGWRTVPILPNGDVIMCQNIGDIVKLGNIKDGFERIFINNPIVDFLKNFKISIDQPECEDCEYNIYCSKCLAKIILSNQERIRRNKGLCSFVINKGINKYINFETFFPSKIIE